MWGPNGKIVQFSGAMGSLLGTATWMLLPQMFGAFLAVLVIIYFLTRKHN